MALAYLMIGEVLRPQGVRGEMKVRPYAADPDMFLEWTTLYLQQGESYLPRKAHCSRVHDGFAYLTLEGVTDRDGAEALRGTQLWIDRAHAASFPRTPATFVSLWAAGRWTRRAPRSARLRMCSSTAPWIPMCFRRRGAA